MPGASSRTKPCGTVSRRPRGSARRQRGRKSSAAEEAGIPDVRSTEHRTDRPRLALFGVLERADPALVDPGVTAELECLLDDVVTGKQEMMGAIDAVCDAARRIIGRLGDGAVAGEAVELRKAVGGENGGERPPTAAMKKLAGSIARREGIKPPAGYTKSGAICRRSWICML